MTERAEIPEDLMTVAREVAIAIGNNQPVYYEWRDDVIEKHDNENADRVARALAAERERAADTIDALVAALERVKLCVVGDRSPNWNSDMEVTRSRMRIADVCDAALARAKG